MAVTLEKINERRGGDHAHHRLYKLYADQFKYLTHVLFSK